MKKIKAFTFLLLPFILLSNQLTAQNKSDINLDAVKFLNSYLNEKSIINDTQGEFIYDKYSNSLNYSSTTIMYENPTTEKEIFFRMTVEFPIPINQIERIVENILSRNDIIIVKYEFYLKDKVKRTVKIKEKGKWLDEETTYTNKVFFSPAKDLNTTETQKLKLVIQDIFPNIRIETERVH